MLADPGKIGQRPHFATDVAEAGGPIPVILPDQPNYPALSPGPDDQ